MVTKEIRNVQNLNLLIMQGSKRTKQSTGQHSPQQVGWRVEFKVTTVCEVMNLIGEIVQKCMYLVKRIFKEME